MKPILAAIILCGTIAFLSACNTSAPPTEEAPAPVPEALAPSYIQEVSGKISSSRYSGKRNLIEELYSELLEKDEELNKLQERIDERYSIIQGGTSELEEYDSKHNQFYYDASSVLLQISDSTTRIYAEELLSSFQENFNEQTKPLKLKSTQLDSLATLVQDHNQLLKFMLALSSMSEYEDQYLPKMDPLLEAESKLKDIEKDVLEREKLLKKAEARTK